MAANAANPTAWTASVITKPIRPGLVREAAFGANGESAVGTGPTALARWERGAWAGLALPPHIDARRVRGVRFLPNGELFLFGEKSLAARLGPGVADLWSFPDGEPTFLAAHVDRDGTITLVGERPIRRSAAASQAEAIGCVAQLSGARVVFAADAPTCTRLHGVTRLVNGPLVACGDWGNIARIDGGSIELTGAICQGHLAAIAPLEDGGAVTVGAGGHALRLSPRLEPALEAVQTTRDLTALAIGSDGVAWAGAVQARLLRRTPDAWIRISGDVGITPSIVALWASDRVVRAICDDAAVIEWRLA
jgi:serine/threonine-protein kinase